jgi:hypothetical protein
MDNQIPAADPPSTQSDATEGGPSQTPSTTFSPPDATSSVTMGQPVVVYGHNENQPKLSGTHRFRWGVIVGGSSGLLLLVAVIMYLYILPTVWSHSYTKAVKPAYEQQVSQMAAVYQSIDRPIFTSSNTTAANDTQDVQYISSIIQTAISNTNVLKTKDHLIVPPGTTWLQSVSLADAEYRAMQQYISDSQAFLEDYKTLLIYVEQIGQIGQTQLPSLADNLNTINKGSSSESTFLADLQNASSNLQSFIDQLKGLKAPADLQEFNQDLRTDLNNMNSALSAQESDIQNNNDTDFQSQRAAYTTAYNNFVTLMSSNPTADIQTNSTIHNQITTLQEQHPIQ